MSYTDVNEGCIGKDCAETTTLLKTSEPKVYRKVENKLGGYKIKE